MKGGWAQAVRERTVVSSFGLPASGSLAPLTIFPDMGDTFRYFRTPVAGGAQEGGPIPGIVDYPSIVHGAMKEFGSVFANQPQREHFAEYLTGLFVAERKTVCGINAEFAVRTDQSCLNRWVTEAGWDPLELNQRRLKWLQTDPSTRYSAHGVIAIDNVLVAHDGELIEDAGWFWDHADQRNMIAHDYLFANYVCKSEKHYPLDFRRFRKRADCDTKRAELDARPGGIEGADERERKLAEFRDHTQLCIELVDWVVAEKIPGDFTFDSYFTNAEILNRIDSHHRGYVGDLKLNRKIQFQGVERKVSEVAALIPPEDRKPIRRGDKTQWLFTKSVRIPKVDHPVRIVILWKNKTDSEPVKAIVTNRTFWEATRILQVYRWRWTGTETFHRDGKQHLGMGDCQLRSGEGQTRHMYLVMLAYSLLVAEMRQSRAIEWARVKLTTIGEACRAVLRASMRTTIRWALDRVTREGWSPERVVEELALV